MNVRLKHDFPFTAGIYHGGNFYMNNYTLRVLMATVSENPDDQTTAFERLKYFIYTCMESTIFIDAAETEQCNQYVQAGLHITTMPGVPVDQLIGIMLYHKLNAVMENRMIVTDVEISSVQGDNMGYLHSHNENLSAGLSLDGWWVDAGPTWYDVPVTPKRDKVVSLNSRPEWAEHGLAWTDVTDKESNSVVFADFGRDADK